MSAYTVLKNFGILVGMIVVMTFAFLALTERNTAMAVETSVMLFKRGRKSLNKGISLATTPNDAEKGAEIPELAEAYRASSGEKGDSDVPDPGFSNDIFTWTDVTYTIRTSDGEERRVLDNVSGFVAPGKLTALMGESGAGELMPGPSELD